MKDEPKLSLKDIKIKIEEECGPFLWFRGCGIGLNSVTGEKQVVLSSIPEGLSYAKALTSSYGEHVVVKEFGSVVAQTTTANFCCPCEDHKCCECCSDHKDAVAQEKTRIRDILLDEIIAQHNMGSSSHLHAKQVLKHLLTKLNLG